MPTTPIRSKSLSPSLCCELQSKEITNKNSTKNVCNSNELTNNQTNIKSNDYDKFVQEIRESDHNKKIFNHSKINLKKNFITPVSRCQFSSKINQNNIEPNDIDKSQQSLIVSTNLAF